MSLLAKSRTNCSLSSKNELESQKMVENSCEIPPLGQNDKVHDLGENCRKIAPLGPKLEVHDLSVGNKLSDFDEKEFEMSKVEVSGFVGDFSSSANEVFVEFRNRKRNRFLDEVIVEKILRLPAEDQIKVLDLVEADDRSLTVSDFYDVLSVLVNGGEYELAVSLFDELSSQGVQLDCWSFAVMVECFCKKNEPEKAKVVLCEMVGNGFHPSEATFSTLVRCLCKAGRVSKAFEVFGIMKKVGCEPTIRTYNYLIGGLCFVGRLEEACDLLRMIKNSSEISDIYTFTLVIDGFCKVGRVDDAMMLVKEAEEIGLVQNVVTYNALLNGYCKEGKPMEALRVLKEMQEGPCFPGYISYTTVLQGLLRWNKVSAAWDTFKKMRAAGFEGDERVMNTLLRKLCKQSVVNDQVLKDAKELFEIIKEGGNAPSPYTYCLMVQALANGGEIDKALIHLHNMVRRVYQPRMMTYNVIRRILSQEGRVGDASGVSVLMIESDIIPSCFSFSILLDQFTHRGELLCGFGVYAVAVKRVVPHWKLYKNVNRKELFEETYI